MSSPSWTPAVARAVLDEQRGWSADRLRYWLSRSMVELEGLVKVRPATPAALRESLALR